MQPKNLIDRNIHHRKALVASLTSTIFIATACGGGGSSTGSAEPSSTASESTSLAADDALVMAQALAVRQSTSAPATSSGVLLGSNTIQASVDSNPSGMAEAFIFAAGASGPASQMNVFLDASSTATHLVVGVYADANGAPGQLLTSSTSTTVTSGSWNTIPVAGIDVVAGNRYWIALLTPPGAGVIKMRNLATGGGGTVTTKQSDLSNMPASWVLAGTTRTHLCRHICRVGPQDQHRLRRRRRHPRPPQLRRRRRRQHRERHGRGSLARVSRSRSVVLKLSGSGPAPHGWSRPSPPVANAPTRFSATIRALAR